MKSEVIAAISTPMAVGGISVIRISGEEATTVADKVFSAKSKELLSSKKGYTMSFGNVFADEKKENLLDDCVAAVFRAPKSYTGENVVELSCHGGIVNTREVLRAVLAAGARLAQPGEFTKRAFLNGKLSLTQAEAVIDMINANNHQALMAARSQKDGALNKRIEGIAELLVKSVGAVAAWIDYPEEDLAPIDTDEMLCDLKKIRDEQKKLVDTFDTGRLIFEGIETVIVGKPNVGKSTLMNLLSKEEKSIVTEIAGTTRDVVEERVNIGDIMLRLCDTAGIRETQDIVEKQGVLLAKKRLSSAQLVIAVFDASMPPDSEDVEILEEIARNGNGTGTIGDGVGTIGNGTKTIAVINKTDLVEVINSELVELLKKYGFSYVTLSAKEQSGGQELEKEIARVVHLDRIDLGAGILQNERQHEAALDCLNAVEEAVVALENGMTLDAVNVLLEDAIEAIFALSGKSTSTAVIDNVFSNFCLGK